ncbi:MAG: NAD(P)H-quinone oxidoreductase subunit [Clostridia bacterium]|nr:NAD(P)H-quinone oxidoreductase subunit [Clostridia bacterium]
MNNFLVLGALIFAIGAYGVLTRRNVVFIFMGLEIMFSGVGITLAAFAQHIQPASALGQIFILFILTVAAAETALGLAIFLRLAKTHGTVQADKINELKG